MILPSPSTNTAAYWQAATQGTLLLKYCESCAIFHHPRQPKCTCGQELVWRPSTGRGALVSYTVVHYGLNPVLAKHVPYTITLTKLSEGPQILTAIPGDHEDLQCGMAMKVTFDHVTPEVALPRFVPASE